MVPLINLTSENSSKSALSCETLSAACVFNGFSLSSCVVFIFSGIGAGVAFIPAFSASGLSTRG